MSNANLGLFHWIRESVRRSVLLGFSDAVEQLGVPADSGELNPHLVAALRDAPLAALEQSSPGRTYAKPEQRKRLGRSLDQLRDTSKPSAPGSAA